MAFEGFFIGDFFYLKLDESLYFIRLMKFGRKIEEFIWKVYTDSIKKI